MYLDQSPWITLSPESSAQPKLGLKQLISLCNPSRPGQAARVVNATVNLDALVGCRSVVHNLQGGVAQGMGPCHLAAEALASCFRAIRPFAGFLQLRREARLKSCEPSLLACCACFRFATAEINTITEKSQRSHNLGRIPSSHSAFVLGFMRENLAESSASLAGQMS